MSWYEGWFDSEAYDLVYAHRDESEAQQLVNLIEREIAPESGAHVIDVGCGRGRHARIFARRGYDMTGVDLSTEAIQEARHRARQENLDVRFLQGDMRDPVCDGCADGVVNLFTTFGYFEDDVENREALAAMATALRPDGWFFQDFLNAPRVIETLEPTDTREVQDVTIRQQRWVEDGRINKKITLERNGTVKTYRESVRLYTVEDLTTMYEAVGFELVDTYGSYDGTPYTADSPRLLLYARKRRDA